MQSRAEGHTLMGAACEVQNVQGGGLLDEINQQSIEVELELPEIPFRRRKGYYKGRELDKRYVPDLFIFDKKRCLHGSGIVCRSIVARNFFFSSLDSPLVIAAF